MTSRKEVFKRWLPELLCAGLFVVAYTPYFISLWIPLLEYDSFHYLVQAKDIFFGDLPLTDFVIDLPPALALFIALILSLGGSLKHLILLQTVIQLLSFSYLIRCVTAFSFVSGLSAAVLCGIYATTSEAMRWNSTVMTESLYISALVLLSASCIKLLTAKRPSYAHYLCLGFAVVVCVMIRSNGIYLLSIPLVIAAKDVISSRSFRAALGGAIALLTAITMSSGVNLILKGTVIPFDNERIVNAFNKKILGSENPDELKLNPQDPRTARFYQVDRGVQTRRLWGNLAVRESTSHYYQRLPYYFDEHVRVKVHKGLRNINEQGMVGMRNFKKVSSSEPPPDLEDFILKNLHTSESYLTNAQQLVDINRVGRNLWIDLNHRIIHPMGLLVRNMFVMLLFYIIWSWSSILALIRIRKQGYTTHDLIFILGLLHILSLVLLTLWVPSNWSLMRYAYVSEFIPLIVTSLWIGSITGRDQAQQASVL